MSRKMVAAALLLAMSAASCGKDAPTKPAAPEPVPNAAMLGSWSGVMFSSDSAGSYQDSLFVSLSGSQGSYGIIFRMDQLASITTLDSLGDPAVRWTAQFWWGSSTFSGMRTGSVIQGVMSSSYGWTGRWTLEHAK